MKIALAASPVRTRDVPYNLSSILQTAARYSEKADMVLFGEASLQGFDCLEWDYETDRQMAVSLDDPRIMQICQAAKQYRIAISFGYIEKTEDALYSSQIVIDDMGAVIANFHRVSVGWKEYRRTDEHYREGNHFGKFYYGGKSFAIGLCGDLWTEGRPEEMKALNADVVLWPVWCDYDSKEWNEKIKFEYAQQAALCGDTVLLVNPYCADADMIDAAAGGAACFKSGGIAAELPSGSSGAIIVEI